MREQILKQATRLFAARGFDGTSLADIASAVGIKKASLLYHFASKDELRRSVLEKLFTHWQKVLPSLLKAATTGVGRFEALSRELVSFFTETPDRARLILREALDHPDGLREAIASHVTPWVTLVCDQIRAGQRQNTVQADVDPEAYVAQVVTLAIAGVAIFDSMAAALKERSEGKEPSNRFVEELFRVARSSLFVPREARTRPEDKNPTRKPTKKPTAEGARAGGPTQQTGDTAAASSDSHKARKGEAR